MIPSARCRRLPFRGAALTLLFVLAYTALAQDITVYHPGASFVLRFTVPGAHEIYNHHRVDVSTYAYGSSQSLRVLYSAQIVTQPNEQSPAACRDAELAALRQRPAFGNPAITMSAISDTATFVAQQPSRVAPGSLQRNVHRYWKRDDLCLKVHVSKPDFREGDERVLDVILESVRFDPLATGMQQERSLAGPGGPITLTMPLPWGYDASRSTPGAPDTAIMLAPQGDARLMVNLLPQRPGQEANVLQAARETAEGALAAARAQASQTEIALKEIASPSARGYYFFVSDRALVGKPNQPDNWKHMTQGALAIGPAIALFSFFSNQETSPALDEALAILRSARLTKP